jgi:hypothetical protein
VARFAQYQPSRRPIRAGEGSGQSPGVFSFTQLPSSNLTLALTVHGLLVRLRNRMVLSRRNKLTAA